MHTNWIQFTEVQDAVEAVSKSSLLPPLDQHELPRVQENRVDLAQERKLRVRDVFSRVGSKAKAGNDEPVVDKQLVLQPVLLVVQQQVSRVHQKVT